MIPYSRRLMAPQWMLWHVFRYRDGRQQSGNQRGSARDAALSHELSMITTSNITEATATPTTTTMTATTTATIRSVSSVPGMLSARANSEYVSQLRIIHSISHPPQWKEAVLRSRTGEVPHLIVQRSIDCPTWLLQVAATSYLSIRAFIRSSKHSQLQNPVDNRRSAPVPCRHIFDSIDRSGTTVLFSISSKRTSSLSPSQHRGAGRGRSGTQTQEKKNEVSGQTSPGQ